MNLTVINTFSLRPTPITRPVPVEDAEGLFTDPETGEAFVDPESGDKFKDPEA